MRDFLTNQYVLLTLTFGAFFGAKLLQKRTGWILLNPILLAIAAIIAFLMLCDIPYETYQQSASLIDFWLKPAVVALGVPLYLQLSSIRKQLIPILMSQFIGCVVGIVSVVLTAKLLGATPMVVMSLATRPAMTIAAPARRSKALTLHPWRPSTPLMTAILVSTWMFAPMRFSSPV